MNLLFFRYSVRDHLQISLLVLSEFKIINELYFPWNNQKPKGFLMISRGNGSLLILLILDAKFGDDPLLTRVYKKPLQEKTTTTTTTTTKNYTHSIYVFFTNWTIRLLNTIQRNLSNLYLNLDQQYTSLEPVGIYLLNVNMETPEKCAKSAHS